MNYVFHFRIFSIVERFRQVHLSGIGKDALFRQESQGWFFCLEPGLFFLGVGPEKPEAYREGDRIKLTMEKIYAVP